MKSGKRNFARTYFLTFAFFLVGLIPFLGKVRKTPVVPRGVATALSGDTDKLRLSAAGGAGENGGKNYRLAPGRAGR